MFSVYDEVKNNVFNPGMHVFTRNGSYFGVVAKPQRHTLPQDIGKWGGTDLYIAIGRGSAAWINSNLSMLLVPVHHGVMVPYAMETSATQLILHTAYGDICLCFAEPNLLLVKGENGLGLLVEQDMVLHQFLRRRKENSWEFPTSPVCSFVATVIDGDFLMDSKYDYQRLSYPTVRGEVQPDENGRFLLAIEEFTHLGITRSAFPSYEEGLADVEADWNAYLSSMPEIPEFGAAREAAAYLTWSLLAAPSTMVVRPQIFCSFGQGGTAWQSCLNAMAVSGNLPLAVELLLSQLDHQSPGGQIPMFGDDTRLFSQNAPTPAQGWALEYLMKRHNVSEEIGQDKLQALYEGLSKWVNWWDIARTDEAAGVPQYEGVEECGFDGCPVFEKYNVVALPDLCAFLALLEEKLGDIAKILGKEADSAAWYACSKSRIDLMLRTFWNGKRFTGLVPGTGETLDCESLVFYRPLILGSRLPGEIIDAMAADLAEKYLTPYGVSANCVDGAGQFLAPENALIVMGLDAAGRKDLAKQAAENYCKGVANTASPYFAAERCFNNSWSAAAFQVLAEYACGN